MKRALLFCIVGVLCMGAIPYAAIGWDFPGNLTVQENVGIGTTSPASRLEIQSNPNEAALTGTVSIVTGAIAVTGSGTQFTTQLAVGDVVTMDTRTYTVTNVLSNTVIFIDPSYQGATVSGINVYLGAVIVPPLLTINTLTNGIANPKVTITDIGYVGIGTTNPQTKLEVAGNLKAATLTATGVIKGGSTLYVPKSITLDNVAKNNNPNKALCWHSSGLIGYCTSAINSSGGCTCTPIQ